MGVGLWGESRCGIYIDVLRGPSLVELVLLIIRQYYRSLIILMNYKWCDVKYLWRRTRSTHPQATTRDRD